MSRDLSADREPSAYRQGRKAAERVCWSGLGWGWEGGEG
eukprot:SAG31_NODE_21981_length_536_cov_1.137300_2_plen_38_part_01